MPKRAKPVARPSSSKAGVTGGGTPFTVARKIALSLPGTLESPHVDRTAFKVFRIYATVAPDKKTMNLKLSSDEQSLKCLTAPDIFSPVEGGWGRMGWTTMALGKANQDDVRAALETAWAHAVVKSRPRSKR